jgi:hypothetical protein
LGHLTGDWQGNCIRKKRFAKKNRRINGGHGQWNLAAREGPIVANMMALAAQKA